MPGLFIVEPNYGQSLTTNFQFQATQWTDPDLPLRYQFGYISQSNLATLTIAGVSESSIVYSLLPSGASNNRFILNCSAQIFDCYDGFTSAFYDVNVTAVSTSAELLKLSLNLVNEYSTDVNTNKQLISSISSELNIIDCSLAPNCTLLHRKACSTIPNSCGECFDSYVGDSLNKNSACISQTFHNNQSISILSKNICQSDFNCLANIQYCNLKSNLCEMKSKTCINDCSSNGPCIFISKSGAMVDSCGIFNTTCDAVCNCADEYSGISCEISQSQLLTRLAIRTKLIEKLYFVTLADDVNMQSIVSWASSLSSISQNPFEISPTSSSKMKEIAQLIVQHAIDNNWNIYESLETILQTMNAVFSVTKYDYNKNSTNTNINSSSLITRNEDKFNVGNKIIDILSLYSNLVLLIIW
jgi:hypothetical protein